jgi:hypothetical protein
MASQTPTGWHFLTASDLKHRVALTVPEIFRDRQPMKATAPHGITVVDIFHHRHQVALQPVDDPFEAKEATMSNTVTTDTAVEADAPVLLAVSYLRVSTREQAERGGTEEGFSIPAQREANARKAASWVRGSCASSSTLGSRRGRRIVTGCRRCWRSSPRPGCSSASCTSSTGSPATAPTT